MKVWFALKFHLENPLIDYINTLVSFVALNFIFLLCCIPVITIAPALTAMYTVTLHEVKGENGYIIRTYCRQFGRNFGQPFVTGICLSVLLLIVGFAAVFWNEMGTAASSAAAVILLAAAVVIYSAMMYAFPLMARYQNSWKQTVKMRCIWQQGILPVRSYYLQWMLYSLRSCVYQIWENCLWELWDFHLWQCVNR